MPSSEELLAEDLREGFLMSSFAQEQFFQPEPSGIRRRPPVTPIAFGEEEEPERNGVLVCMRDPEMARHCAVCYAAQGVDVCISDTVLDWEVFSFLDRTRLILFDDDLFREQSQLGRLIAGDVKIALVTSRSDQDLMFKAARFGVETVACSMLAVRLPS